MKKGYLINPKNQSMTEVDVKDYTDMSTDETVEFQVTLYPGMLEKLMSELVDSMPEPELPDNGLPTNIGQI